MIIDLAYVKTLFPDSARNILAVQHTGSSYVCDPPVKDTDIDILILVNDTDEFYVNSVLDGCDTPMKYTGDEFTSYRRGKLNLIVTDQNHFYKMFCVATKIAKRLNVKDKTVRVALFEAIIHQADLLK